jgi:hypothetical protein
MSSPGTRTTRLASSSAKLGMTDRGPSDPADSNKARRIWGPKCFRRVSAIGSSGEGNRVVASRSTCSQRRGHGTRLTKKPEAVVSEKRSCAARPMTPRDM